MQEQMQQVFHTLGKVTGEEDEVHDGDSTSKMTANSHMTGYDEKLAQRAEEIVLIVEQV